MADKKFFTLKDVSSGDGLSSGLIASGLYFLHTDGKWYRTRGTVDFGLNVEIKKSIALVMAGDKTPSDAYANPTDAVPTFSFLAGWNGTTWDRIRSSVDFGLNVEIKKSIALVMAGDKTPSDAYANPTDAVPTFSFLAGWNNATWDRLRTAPTPADTGILQGANHFKHNYSLLASAARTTSSQTAELTGFGSFRTAIIRARVTAASGTLPTLDVYIDTTIGAVNWINLIHFTQFTDVGWSWRGAQLSEHSLGGTSDFGIADLPAGTVQQGPWGSSLRVRWVISGSNTPTFTFNVNGTFKS